MVESILLIFVRVTDHRESPL